MAASLGYITGVEGKGSAEACRLWRSSGRVSTHVSRVDAVDGICVDGKNGCFQGGRHDGGSSTVERALRGDTIRCRVKAAGGRKELLCERGLDAVIDNLSRSVADGETEGE